MGSFDHGQDVEGSRAIDGCQFRPGLLTAFRSGEIFFNLNAEFNLPQKVSSVLY